ncbi:hypothetical protein OHT57_37635 [Streptomyces sp. NBC_00285]|uniref:hypothetical protein n=1 Tax=Streptomyces sp. NBC_00285 TaxID=2975700 RepID=UPI002E2A9248|nr:hypothetical protein [Streptomyces sp. NBC_00285]
MNRNLLRDLYAAGCAAVLVVAAVLVGRVLQHRDGSLHVDWPPLLASWDPHVGPGTPAAIVVAVAVVAYGPALAARLPWRPLLLTVWGAGMAWTWSLALVDGWQRGVAGQLTSRNEYVPAVDRFHDIPAALRDFDRHILIGSPDNWGAHVAGHPPGATLTFVLLDRIGLGGGGWAGTWCITVGTTAAVAVLIAVRTLTDESLARRAAPFLVLAPAAVWVGTSADGYFAAVAAWAVALLALAVRGHRPGPAGFASGLLFGLTVYLSYGLTLMAVVAGAVLLLGSRRPLGFVLAGFVVVPLLFTVLGFDWWEAYRLLVTRYHQGAGGVRPYGYWVWANLAGTVFIVGPATVAGVRRAVVRLWRRRGSPRPVSAPPDRGELRLGLLVCAALLALLVADLSGMSKAETERIWLPFAVWLLPACALVTGARGWLAGQAVLALLVNHLLLTGW